MKRAALSAPSASIAPPRCVGSLATTPSGRPSIAGQRGHHPGREAAPQLERLVAQRVDHRADVVDALAVGRDQVAQRVWSGTGGSGAGAGRRAGEEAQVALGGGDRRGVVGDPQVDHAVGVLDVDRADLLRREHAEAAALDHRRAAHPDARVLGGDDHVAAAEQGGVAGKAVAARRSRPAARGR